MLTLRPYQQTALDALLSSLKRTDNPLLVTASVGAGKSLLIAALLKRIESAGMRALCLTLNSELIRNNCQTYRNQGGNSSIFCSGLGERSYDKPIVFASPHSLVIAMRTEHPIANIPFNLIVVDEAHCIDLTSKHSMYMRIFNHYATLTDKFRIVGLTGTPFRGKSVSIVGEHAFFKEEVCNITTSYLIDQGYLVRPHFNPNISSSYDFSQLRIKPNGKFDEQQLQEIVDKNHRLTGKLMQDLQSIKHTGAFVFCVSKRHCEEASRSLSPGTYAIVTGDTPHKERTAILQSARESKIKYLLSVNCLMTGVDIPNYNCVAWLRPTESLGLYVQGTGRGLRLAPGKTNCTILDFAGNIDRHGDTDDPMINEAVQPKSLDDPDYCIPCYECGALNTTTCRRCIGLPSGKRCTYYFEFKECPSCGAQNDKVARQCRSCTRELIDPNSKLRPLIQTREAIVFKWYINVSEDSNKIPFAYIIHYKTDMGDYVESYMLSSKKALNIFYANFVKKHLESPSKYYMSLHKRETLDSISSSAKQPRFLTIANGRIKTKHF